MSIRVFFLFLFVENNGKFPLSKTLLWAAINLAPYTFSAAEREDIKYF